MIDEDSYKNISLDPDKQFLRKTKFRLMQDPLLRFLICFNTSTPFADERERANFRKIASLPYPQSLIYFIYSGKFWEKSYISGI